MRGALIGLFALAAVVLAMLVVSGRVSFWIEFERHAPREQIAPVNSLVGGVEPWNPPEMADSGVQFAFATNRQGNLVVLQKWPGGHLGEVRATFTGEQPIESFWLQTPTGMGLIGVATADARSAGVTKRRRAGETKIKPVPGHPGLRAFGIHFTDAEAGRARRVFIRDADGRTLERLPMMQPERPGPVQ